MHWSTLTTLRWPRHPLVRLLAGLAGFALLGFFSLLGLLAAAVLLATLTVRQWLRRFSGKRTGRSRPVDPRIIEGEFSVVEKSPLPHQGMRPR